jgi:ABC-2 type transport system ATP-binding protein
MDIRAEGLSKRFGPRLAIDGIDLEVREGVCFGFLGPNGAGKTTLIRLMLGLARPDSGRVLIGGVDVQRDPQEALRHVGAIVEEPRFHDHLTGIENLQVHAALLGGGAAGRIGSVLERVGLDGRGEDKVKGYSMGMRQRLGVGRALLGDPALLVLDEPTNGLDAEGMAEFRELIRAMVDREERTIFISSHLLDEMQKLCDEVAIVEQGRVVEQTSVTSFIAAGGHAVVVHCDDPDRAREILGAISWVEDVADSADGRLRISCPPGPQHAAFINHRLVKAGVGVAELREEVQSLEERYLDVTRQEARR